MKLIQAKLLTVAVATALAASVSAQEAHDPMAGAGKNDPIEAEMRLMDKNQDGEITAAEHAGGAQEQFKALDANRDGRVTAAEMNSQKPMKATDASHHKGKPSTSDKLKAADANGDGALTAQEHADGAQKMFRKMDTDGNGSLTTAEIKAEHKDLMMSRDGE